MTTRTKRPTARANTPAYDLDITANANGKVGKATVTALDKKTKTVLAMDQGNLTDAREREKLAKRLAAKLGKNENSVLKRLEKQWNKLIEDYRRLQEQAKAGSPEAAPGFRAAYQESGGCICRRYIDPQFGLTLDPLCNFTCHVLEDLRIDDGVEVQHVFVLDGKLSGGPTGNEGPELPIVRVPASEFGTMRWPTAHWGLRAVVGPGQGVSDQLRCGIQVLSKNVIERIIYRHTGWRQLGGRWVYLHAGGAITPDGLDKTIECELEGRLAGYDLPEPPEGQALCAAVRASLALLELAPLRVMAPLLGMTYLAPHGGADFWGGLVGATGLGKSELAALCQGHYGRTFSRLFLPGNWSSTDNALETIAFLCKDALLVLDDFKPAGNRYQSDAMHAKAERVLRAQGNSSGRGRCRGDGTVRPDRPPRGLVMITGEDMPRGESLQARGLPVPLRRGDLDVTKLTPYQQLAAAGVYAQAMSGYLRWIAQRYEELRDARPQEHAKLRAKALGKDKGRHPRCPDIMANLAWGWKCFLDFARATGAISQSNRDKLAGRTWEGIKEAAQEQTRELESRDPARRFLELLAAAISSCRAHLCGPEGQEPKPDPKTWGWKLEERGAGDFATVSWRAQGNCVGWLEGSDLYLDPEASYAAAQLMGTAQGESLGVSKDQLSRRLKDAGLLLNPEKDRTRVRRMLQGMQRSVLNLHRDALSTPEITGQTGQIVHFSGETGHCASQGEEQTCDQPNPEMHSLPSFAQGGGGPAEEKNAVGGRRTARGTRHSLTRRNVLAGKTAVKPQQGRGQSGYSIPKKEKSRSFFYAESLYPQHKTGQTVHFRSWQNATPGGIWVWQMPSFPQKMHSLPGLPGSAQGKEVSRRAGGAACRVQCGDRNE
jgi:hypothetical protein